MALFQNSILNKYLATLDTQVIEEAYQRFCAYFHDTERQKNILSSKEEQFQEGFLNALFVGILGYTLNPDPDYNLITEKKDTKGSKKADAAILQDGEVVAVVELKDHKTPDLDKVERQAFGYKNQHKKATYVVISNFQRLRFYIDNAVEYVEWNLFTLTRDEFATLWLCLSHECLMRGLPKSVKNESVSNEEHITNKLYKDYIAFKRELFGDILKRNTTKEGDHSSSEWKVLLFKKTQKLLDRMLFILFAEDCGLLPPNSIKAIIDQWRMLIEADEDIRLYSRIKKYFGYMNTGYQGKKYEVFAYNGGLFKPDEVLDNLEIDDELLAHHTLRLSEYDFASDVDVDILGHIFENSLNEIEEVTAQLEHGEAPAVSKRKKDGVFYTPQYITKYIVENTVGRLCNEKKLAFGIDELDYYSDNKRTAKDRKRMLEALTAYREWLLQITICDPACGSGAFLNAALHFLMDEHHRLDEMEANVTGSTIVFPGIENAILENNLFGVDINEESVEIARLALWLRTAKPHRKLSSLNNNIKCGNSLISDPAVAGDKAFNWEEEFPQVFAKGGFDVVIGNPPYVSANEIKKSYSEAAFKYIKKEYVTAKGTVDLYIYFFELGITIVKNNGYLSYITPNRYLSASYGCALRQWILDKYSFIQLIDYSDTKVFEDASTYPVISIIQKTKESDNVVCGKFDEISHELISKLYPSDKLNILEDSILGFLLNDKLTITQKVIAQSVPISNVGSINATSTAKEADEYASLISESIDCGYKLINTGTIDPYTTTWGYSTLTKQGKQYLRPYLPKSSSLISQSRHELYSSPKIIISKIGLQCEAFWDKEGMYASIDTNCIHHFNDDYLPEYVLCWLNSSLYNYMFECLFDGLRMSGGYLLYSSPNIKNTYIKQVPIEKQSVFVDLSSSMLSLTGDLQKLRSRFHRRMKENLGITKITTALETFDLLTFEEFTNELKKQKVKLTLIQQDEWEDYFNQYKTECEAKSETIRTTDAEIDHLVYALYGLTEEEIATVEG